jgi:hypothetical protein
MPNPQKTVKWMSEEHYCQADFSVFASLLGYAYDGDNPVGRRVPSPGTKPDKDKLYDLYDSIGVVGFINGLHPLYDQLARIFRENIAPSGGNNDARSSAPTCAQRAATTAMSREVKKLSWFERNVLCMKVEIHRENYQAYMEFRTINS